MRTRNLINIPTLFIAYSFSRLPATFASSTTVLVGLAMLELYPEFDSARPVLAWGALLLWIHLMQFLDQVESIGPMISVMFDMAVDTIIFMAVMAVIA
eukprot:COSAG01_NODE_57951_length_309_cov_0.723810_1_plen_97_part_01